VHRLITEYVSSHPRNPRVSAQRSVTAPEAVRIYSGATAQHTCAVILPNTTAAIGNLKCWGSNTYGQLGYGDTTNRGTACTQMGDSLAVISLGTSRKARLAALGQYHTCVILDDHTLKCFGYNSYGQLGLGDISTRGDQSGEMGDALPIVSLGTGRTASAVALGDYHTCVLLDNAGVKCFGYGGNYRLGYSDTTSRGYTTNQMGTYLPLVPAANANVTSISVGEGHTCVIKLGSVNLTCWGVNSWGNLGVGDTTDRSSASISMGSGRKPVSVQAGAQHTCAILDDNSVKCWGSNSNGQLVNGNQNDQHGPVASLGSVSLSVTGSSIPVRMVAGLSHTCVIMNNNCAACAGNNTYGQLGYGDTTTRKVFTGCLSIGLYANKTSGVKAFNQHTCAVRNNTDIVCWGYNAHGKWFPEQA
jgi:alpha-tubulin suppressor-like RCC1 family protein